MTKPRKARTTRKTPAKVDQREVVYIVGLVAAGVLIALVWIAAARQF